MFIPKRRASIETTIGITPHEQRVQFRDMSLRGRYVLSPPGGGGGGGTRRRIG